ncbi:DNA-binding transcriptional regulator YhcF (GntR family) [Rhizobium leucaenae]|nr:DNA-binding transcriptional regulator YhcF (GntR family) [Rhizobium leucaenae]
MHLPCQFRCSAPTLCESWIFTANSANCLGRGKKSSAHEIGFLSAISREIVYNLAHILRQIAFNFCNEYGYHHANYQVFDFMNSTVDALQTTSGPTETGAQQIRDAIREAIVERRLSPGTKLSESDVGNLFNVSRTLARAALQALSYEGLVNVEKNRGAFVAYPSPDEARQIFAARRLVEPGILSEAAKRITPSA